MKEKDLDLTGLIDERLLKTPNLGEPLHEKSSPETGLENRAKTGSTVDADHRAGADLPQTPDLSSAS